MSCSAAYRHPSGTRRPNAKDDLRARAIELRGQGRSVNAIAAELGVSKSTACLWVRHLPFDRDDDAARERRRAHSKAMTDARWGEYGRPATSWRPASATRPPGGWAAQGARAADRRCLLVRGQQEQALAAGAAAEVHQHRPGVGGAVPALRRGDGRRPAATHLQRGHHESADAAAAARWWADRINVDVDVMRAATIKRHEPATNRRNTGDDYHGCLVVTVPRSRQLYTRTEGSVAGIFGGLPPK